MTRTIKVVITEENGRVETITGTVAGGGLLWPAAGSEEKPVIDITFDTIEVHITMPKLRSPVHRARGMFGIEVQCPQCKAQPGIPCVFR